MKRLNFYRTYTQEAIQAADLGERLLDQTFVEDFHTVSRVLDKLGAHKPIVNDWDTMSAIAAIYRFGIAVGIRTERKRRKELKQQ